VNHIMQVSSVENRQVRVKELISSRYPNGVRPASWDYRTSGIDVVRDESGETLRLQSDGGQSSPKPGWIIVLTDGDAEHGFTWTLYGIHPSAAAR
ncbi:MAG: hypothetical protein J5J00_15900, partial [Deltaproteobacteria bacterium]|nr:hypothetical protein [Deltaproteobacteria bacterium]